MQGGVLGKGIRVGIARLTCPVVFSRLEQVFDAEPPGSVADKIPNTTHDTFSRKKSNFPGLQEVTDPKVMMLTDWSPTTAPVQNQLFDLNESSETILLRIEIPENRDRSVDSYVAYTITCRVGSFKPLAPLDNRQTLETVFIFDGGTFELTGPGPSIL